MKKKVVLAFSGGLDTSFCAKYLALEKDLEVYSAIVNTGGFSPEELKNIEEKAISLGVKQHISLDETESYYQKIVKYLIFGNILRNNTYPLSVSSERMTQAMAIAQYALKINADYIAHGSTGAGNDQVRFDLAFQVLAPQIEILTPIRELSLSREEEIQYLQKNGIEANWEKAKYSINKGLWGTSIGGKETLTSHMALPEEAYPSQLERNDPQDIRLEFHKGELISLVSSDKEYKNKSSVELIQILDQIASQYAIGRDIHVGDTIIGIKGRVAFEAAAPLIIIRAHHTLEKHVLSKWQLHWKEQMANWYGMFLHEALYLDPVMRNIEHFLEDTQEFVTGIVHVQLAPYRFDILGIGSPYDLMQSKFGVYGEKNNAWSGDDVKGFTKMMANQLKIYHATHQD